MEHPQLGLRRQAAAVRPDFAVNISGVLHERQLRTAQPRPTTLSFRGSWTVARSVIMSQRTATPRVHPAAMARALLVLSALAASACGNEESYPVLEQCSEGWGDGPDVLPEFPSCDCVHPYCSDGGSCYFVGDFDDLTSSVCLPPCAETAECPMLGELKTTCCGGLCQPFCEQSSDCPQGYTCAIAGSYRICEVVLTPTSR